MRDTSARWRFRYSTWGISDRLWLDISTEEVERYLNHDDYRVIRGRGRWLVVEYLGWRFAHPGQHSYLTFYKPNEEV